MILCAANLVKGPALALRKDVHQERHDQDAAGQEGEKQRNIVQLEQGSALQPGGLLEPSQLQRHGAGVP